MAASGRNKDTDDARAFAKSGSVPAKYRLSGPLPPLRQLEVRQLQVKNNEAGDPDGSEMVFVLQDPDGWTNEQALVAPAAFAVASLFDGEKDAKGVAAEFKQRFNLEIAESQILSLAHEFDRSLLLASPRFEDTLRKAVLKYMTEPVRPAALAGEAYPEEPGKLLQTLEGFFTSEEGPGSLPSIERATEHRIKGMMLPKIDLQVGGGTYAQGYKALVEGTQADLFVILGGAHRRSTEVLFNVSTKDHATPWGPVKTARGLAQRLQQKAGAEPLLAEFCHRTELSIEFQTLFLEALYGQHANKSYEIVPILCGSCEPFIVNQSNPSQDDDFRRFIDGLRDELEKSNRKWCILACADLSHVGPKFSHQGTQMSTAMTERLLLPVERMDRRMLAKFEALQPDAFYFEIARTRNSRNVDAVIAGLAMLAAGEGVFTKGKLLHYDIMIELSTKSAVSFASMSFE